MLNRVVLVGRLTRDPELRYTPNGVAVATFTIAVNRTFSNQQGEREADFINVIVWRKAAENVANFLKKGSLAGVDGRLQSRSYENNEGRRVYVTEVVASAVQFLESRRNAEGEGNNYSSNRNSAPQRSNQQPSSNRNTNFQKTNTTNNYQAKVEDDPFADQGQIDISDDDLPF
jgi:single-strand DNA-binding protein